MGVIQNQEAIRAAKRHAAAARKQQATRTVESDASGLDRRREFMLASGRVFFESVIDRSDLMPVRSLAVGLLAGQAVGRVHLPPTKEHGDGFATGFLVAPNLMLTNRHVLVSPEWARMATFTMDAEDGIEGTPKAPRVYQLDPGRLYVSDEDLDFAFVAVCPKSIDGFPLSRYGYLRLFADTGKIVRDEHVTIIQHPNGRQKHIASRDNTITVYVYDDDLPPEERAANNFLYYSTDTLAGSSGSPVLSDQWFVVALHRRGVPETRQRGENTFIVRNNGKLAAADDPDEVIRYKSNEGIRISRVLARLAAIAATADHPQRDSAIAAEEAIKSSALRVTDGPLALPSIAVSLLDPGAARIRPAAAADAIEIARRKPSVFEDAKGYKETFLRGHRLPLPHPNQALRRELAPRLDLPQEFLLPFDHFTTAMHARRRLPVFAAVNIDGKKKPDGGMGKRPAWGFDPRIDLAHQPDDSIFSNMLQRGHMAARDYVFWGDTDEEINRADLHSFTLTNVCPQIADFNAHVEWFQVERQVADGAKAEERRVTEFVGPILRADDPDFDDLRSNRSRAERGTHIRVPLRFWKIVAWVEDGALKHRAFILDQSDELEDAGPLELDIETPEGVKDSTVEEISRLTDLVFEGF